MGKGKKTGKILFSIAAFAIGYNNPANAQAILGTTTFFIKPYNAGGYSTNALTDNITIDVLPSVQTLYSHTGFDKLCSIDSNGVIAEGYTIQKSSITWADIKNKTWGELKNSTIIGSAVGNAVLLSPVITLDTLSQASIIINEDWIAPADNPNIYKISTSTDGVTFSDFKLLGSGNIPMKAFQLQITLAGVDIPARLKKIDIDVVATQNTLNYPNQTIPVGGLELTYSQSFSNIPSVIVSPNATVALTIKKENITTTSCKISLLDSSGTDVGGQADIFIVGI